jgi:hypothetical protein
MRHFVAKFIDFRYVFRPSTNRDSEPDVLDVLTESEISLYSPTGSCSAAEIGPLGISGSFNCHLLSATYQEE